MNDQPIKQWLVRADTALTPADDPAGLGEAFARQVCQEARRRRQTRRRNIVAMMVVGMVLIGGAIWLHLQESQAPQTPMAMNPPKVEPLVPKVEPLVPKDGRPEVPPDSSLALEAHQLLSPNWQSRDDTAGALVLLAERRQGRVGRDQTIRQLETVVELYPDTYWAEVARTKTHDLKKQAEN